MTLCQYFRNLFLRLFPGRNVVWAWIRFSKVPEQWMFEIPIILTWGRTWVFQQRKLSEASPRFCFLCIHTLCFSYNPKHRNLAEGGRWLCSPVLRITTPNPPRRELLVQELSHAYWNVWEKGLCWQWNLTYFHYISHWEWPQQLGPETLIKWWDTLKMKGM